MPELPEVETIARDLQGRVCGATVSAVRIAKHDILAPGTTAARLRRNLPGRRISDVRRRGKNLVLTFDGDLRLVVNLGMTGRVVSSDSPRAGELGHVAARIDLEDGRSLLYDDARRFGRLDLRTEAAWRERDAEIGIEPLANGFSPAGLHSMTRRSVMPIRNWLLDQSRIAGVGNIYANEALFRSGIRPTRRAYRITRTEAGALHRQLRAVLEEAIRDRGTTFSDYRDADGNEGTFQFRLRVYDREGVPCPVCTAPIKRTVLSNRSAFYCPTCQR
jgi:formamidopyrimidine-DNA glycosylase